jgi:hypothetical protein
VVVCLVVALVEEEDINMANTFKFGNENWAVKDGKVLAYNDENNAFKPLPFTFARSSSATRVDNEGIIKTTDSGFARIDFLNNTSGHLLLEPSSTNLVTHSEDFSDSTSWNVFAMTVTSDNVTSPYGTQTADKIEATGNGSIRTQPSFTVSDAYSFSIFVKKGNSRYVTLRSFAFTTSVIIGFDLDTVTAQTGGVIEQYPNDWYRLSISKDVSSDADKNGFFYIYLPDSLGSASSVSGNFAYFFGAQLEDLTYPSSYIPTTGSTVTRAAETCNSAGNSTVFNDSEGVLYWECSSLFDDSTLRIISVSDGSQNNTVQLYFDSSSNRIRGAVREGSGTYQCILDFNTSDTTNFFKVALKYKQNDFALWVNGIQIATDTNGNAPTGLNTLNFDSGSGSNDFFGKIKNVQVYNTALTDAELIELTS